MFHIYFDDISALKSPSELNSVVITFKLPPLLVLKYNQIIKNNVSKDSIDINAINDMNDIVDETIVVDESELEKRDIPLDGEDIVVEEEVVEEPDEEETILNLDYSSGSLDATVSNMSDQSEDDSHEDGPSESDHTNTTPVDKSVADGESDLMNLFK